jgi:hypothetical protein
MIRCKYDCLDATQIERDVDEACDRFEVAWRAGGTALSRIA